MDFSPLVSLDFWFNLTPHALSPGIDRGFFLFFGGLIIAGAIAKIIMRQKRADRYLARAYKMVSQCLMMMGALGMLLFFFTYEEIYLLGARFWFIVWGLGSIVWIYSIIRYARVTIPKLRTRDLEKNKENEYLPRSNRR
ncbi:MAG: hypothetical protein ABH826_05305 [Patescibacteria group bacterium]